MKILKRWFSRRPRNRGYTGGMFQNVGKTQRVTVRRQNSPRALARVFLIGSACVVVILVLLTTLRQSMAFLTENPRYLIQTIDVGETVYVSAREIVDLSGVKQGDSLVLTPIREVRQRLLEHPNIKQAVVQRVLPDGLRISVEEREPLAEISMGKNYLVDVSGFVLSWHESFANKNWTLIEGLNPQTAVINNKIQSAPLQEALNVLKIHKASLAIATMGIKTVQLDLPGGYVFLTDNGVVLRLSKGLSQAQVQRKFGELAAVWQDLVDKGVKAETIDMRFENIVVTPKGKGLRTI